jgi:hypothetical protein
LLATCLIGTRRLVASLSASLSFVDFFEEKDAENEESLLLFLASLPLCQRSVRVCTAIESERERERERDEYNKRDNEHPTQFNRQQLDRIVCSFRTLSLSLSLSKFSQMLASVRPSRTPLNHFVSISLHFESRLLRINILDGGKHIPGKSNAGPLAGLGFG